MLRPVVLTAVLCLGAASLAAGQPAPIGCPANRLVGDLGIDGLECQGCEIHGRPRRESSWIRFHGEPSIRSLRPLGPASGRLQPGDVIATIDGLSITTRAGSDRYAQLEPGQVVHLEVRRSGQLVPVEVEATPSCGAPPSTPPVRRSIRISGAA